MDTSTLKAMISSDKQRHLVKVVILIMAAILCEYLPSLPFSIPRHFNQ